jgi:hypothetical protein
VLQAVVTTVGVGNLLSAVVNDRAPRVFALWICVCEPPNNWPLDIGVRLGFRSVKNGKLNLAA